MSDERVYRDARIVPRVHGKVRRHDEISVKIEIGLVPCDKVEVVQDSVVDSSRSIYHVVSR